MTADDQGAKANTDRRSRCDHICLLDDGHVDRGEPHQYGYELPSPRATQADLVEARAATTHATTQRDEARDEHGMRSYLLDELARAEAERDDLRRRLADVASVRCPRCGEWVRDFPAARALLDVPAADPASGDTT